MYKVILDNNYCPYGNSHELTSIDSSSIPFSAVAVFSSTGSLTCHLASRGPDPMELLEQRLVVDMMPHYQSLEL